MRSVPFCVFGKAMTSRIGPTPQRSAARRSTPKAIPPCGGVPYWSASRKKPNLTLASSASESQDLEHRRLNVGAIDPKASASDFNAVQDHVVSRSFDLIEIAAVDKVFEKFRTGRSKRMVASIVAIFLIIEFK